MAALQLRARQRPASLSLQARRLGPALEAIRKARGIADPSDVADQMLLDQAETYALALEGKAEGARTLLGRTEVGSAAHPGMRPENAGRPRWCAAPSREPRRARDGLRAPRAADRYRRDLDEIRELFTFPPGLSRGRSRRRRGRSPALLSTRLCSATRGNCDASSHWPWPRTPYWKRLSPAQKQGLRNKISGATHALRPAGGSSKA